MSNENARETEKKQEDSIEQKKKKEHSEDISPQRGEKGSNPGEHTSEKNPDDFD
ncbi:hypothetical protein MM300_14425 [Evansella sp. LMS18]|uniref:hypothetical protein n=1 Tax=Evansella sp. LMS18 TaxID=2924033 RepID=UPI0020D0B938|nr:hypothetical protein [Evansella sp. LMS18]UTR09097.1 hypothetical protein MM300_14425 [Evansella sp. LMS18]